MTADPLDTATHWEIDRRNRQLWTRGVAVPIGGRAFEIVEFLVQAENALVTKDELMARVWPGAAVEENTLQVHMSAIRKALGNDRGLLRAVHGRGYRLSGRWTERSEDAKLERSIQPPVVADPTHADLPLPSSEIIGRNDVVQHLGILISAYRLVTLTGPGGIGKTRLALELARLHAGNFKDGAYLIEFGAVSDAALVPNIVAGALGLRPVGNEMSAAAAAVARAIGDRAMLLILDNCEHLIDAAARMAEALVRNCPNACILATSRELLRIDGECAYRVRSLGLPPEDIRERSEALRYPAVQLFVARSRASGVYLGTNNPDLGVESPDLQVVGAICRRLDGIPLAIEFAAARVATLGIESVLSHLEDRFALLTSGRRTALPRHQTLRAVLDWSHDLLSDAEHNAFRRLAAFAGGFTMAAAGGVLSEPDADPVVIIDQVISLVNKSLVGLDAGPGPARYFLLETVRAYAAEKLAEAGEAAAIARRHAQYYTTMLEEAQAGWNQQPAAEWLATYRREIDNVRTALDWAMSAAGDREIAVALSVSSIPLLFDLSLIAECRARAAAALRAIESGPTADPYRRLQALTALQSTRVYTDGPSADSCEAWQQILDLAISFDDQDHTARALWGLWNDHIYRGMPAAALVYAERFRDLALARQNATWIIMADRLVGIALHYRGEQNAARERLYLVLSRYERSIHRWQTMGSGIDQATVTRATLSRVLWLQGKPDQAMRLADTALSAAMADDHTMTMLYVLVEAAIPIPALVGELATVRRNLALLTERAARAGFSIWVTYAGCVDALLSHDPQDRAATLPRMEAAVRALQQSDFRAQVCAFLCGLAETQARLGKLTEALAILDDTMARCDRHGERWMFPELKRVEAETRLAEARPDAEARAHALLRESLDLARSQGALAWELRSTMSLARLIRRQGRPSEARDILAAVYAKFDQGFEAADLVAARALLSEF